MTLLAVDGLEVRYGPVTAVRGVSLRVERRISAERGERRICDG